MQIRLAIAKIEIYNPHSGSSYYVPAEEALDLARNNPHKWFGSKKLMLSDIRQKVTWAPKQSGYAGPLVLQVVT